MTVQHKSVLGASLRFIDRTQLDTHTCPVGVL